MKTIGWARAALVVMALGLAACGGYGNGGSTTQGPRRVGRVHLDRRGGRGRRWGGPGERRRAHAVPHDHRDRGLDHVHRRLRLDVAPGPGRGRPRRERAPRHVRDRGPSGGRQAGHLRDFPLYTYSGDSAPGQANGQGVGGVWFAVPASASAAPAGGGDTGGGYGGYGGKP